MSEEAVYEVVPVEFIECETCPPNAEGAYFDHEFGKHFRDIPDSLHVRGTYKATVEKHGLHDLVIKPEDEAWSERLADIEVGEEIQFDGGY